VADPRVAAERDVEQSTAVEPAEAGEAGTVQIIEERRGFRRLRLLRGQQGVEARAVSVEERLVIGHLDVDREASLYPPVEVDQVRVGVVEEGLRRREAERNGQ